MPAERHRAAVDERVEAPRGAVAERLLGGAARLVGLGGVDVGEADVDARDPQRVAVDHAIGPAAAVAQPEARARRGAAAASSA